MQGTKLEEPGALYAFVTDLPGYAGVDKVWRKAKNPNYPVCQNI